MVVTQQWGVERAQHLCNTLVVGAFKRGWHSCKGEAQGINQLLLVRLQRRQVDVAPVALVNAERLCRGQLIHTMHLPSELFELRVIRQSHPCRNPAGVIGSGRNHSLVAGRLMLKSSPSAPMTFR